MRPPVTVWLWLGAAGLAAWILIDPHGSAAFFASISRNLGDFAASLWGR